GAASLLPDRTHVTQRDSPEIATTRTRIASSFSRGFPGFKRGRRVDVLDLERSPHDRTEIRQRQRSVRATEQRARRVGRGEGTSQAGQRAHGNEGRGDQPRPRNHQESGRRRTKDQERAGATDRKQHGQGRTLVASAGQEVGDDATRQARGRRSASEGGQERARPESPPRTARQDRPRAGRADAPAEVRDRPRQARREGNREGGSLKPVGETVKDRRTAYMSNYLQRALKRRPRRRRPAAASAPKPRERLRPAVQVWIDKCIKLLSCTKLFGWLDFGVVEDVLQ